jgi:hypothetical protein
VIRKIFDHRATRREREFLRIIANVIGPFPTIDH